MNKTGIILLSILGGLVIICFTLFSWVTGTYNGLVGQRETVSTSWAQVETQYQRRFDLIPNLANAAKGYIAHEQKVFKDIADARSQYAGAPAGSKEKIQATNSLEGALSRLLIIVENYPELKADATVASLMDEIAGTENRVNIARQRYNETAKSYNILTLVFPGNILANMFGFEQKTLFEATEAAAEAPKVNLEVKNASESKE